MMFPLAHPHQERGDLCDLEFIRYKAHKRELSGRSVDKKQPMHVGNTHMYQHNRPLQHPLQEWVDKVANLDFTQEDFHSGHDKADHPVHEVEDEVEDSDSISHQISDRSTNIWETFNKT